jgi:hypothetical protein
MTSSRPSESRYRVHNREVLPAEYSRLSLRGMGGAPRKKIPFRERDTQQNTIWVLGTLGYCECPRGPNFVGLSTDDDSRPDLRPLPHYVPRRSRDGVVPPRELHSIAPYHRTVTSAPGRPHVVSSKHDQNRSARTCRAVQRRYTSKFLLPKLYRQC